MPLENVMFRRRVNKQRSARAFNRQARRTKRINTAPAVMRGGFRL